VAQEEEQGQGAALGVEERAQGRDGGVLVAGGGFARGGAAARGRIGAGGAGGRVRPRWPAALLVEADVLEVEEAALGRDASARRLLAAVGLQGRRRRKGRAGRTWPGAAIGQGLRRLEEE
jgi:hypothetical protein